MSFQVSLSPSLLPRKTSTILSEASASCPLTEGPCCVQVFVGGLSWETTDAKLRTYFENYGAVQEAFVSYDRATGRPRGFGFVVFDDPAVADKVTSIQHTIDRREVRPRQSICGVHHTSRVWCRAYGSTVQGEAKKAVPKLIHGLMQKHSPSCSFTPPSLC